VNSQLRILLVDDEPNVLAGLRRMIHMRRPQWDVVTANNGPDALSVMQLQPVDVVISDVFMPGMDGAELLEKIRLQWPGSIRIALSGQVGLAQVIESIRSVHQYIAKPCDNDTLIAKIELVMSCKDFMLDIKMQELVSSIKTLPTVPDVYLAIQQELAKPDSGLDAIAKLITRDMALVAKILAVINSPYFALGRKVQSITQAISLLGLDTIRALVLSSHLITSYEASASTALSLHDLNEHSCRVAAICRILGQYLGLPRSDISRCAMAALLHDIGKLILATCFPTQFHEAIHMLMHTAMPLCEAERIIFGVTHAELGAYLLALWGLEADLVQAIGRHHSSSNLDNSIQMLLHVADVMDHNCIRIKEDHLFRRFNSALMNTGADHTVIQAWADHVETVWTDAGYLPPFSQQTLFIPEYFNPGHGN